MPVKGRPRKTHCKRGHDLSVTRYRTPRGHSRCKACNVFQRKTWVEQNRVTLKAYYQAYYVKHKDRVREPRRRARLKRCYDVTLDFTMGKPCEICGTTAWGKDSHGSIDHDHTCCLGDRTCGKCIRGVLCQSCNRVLGVFAEDIDRFQKTIEYLENICNCLTEECNC